MRNRLKVISQVGAIDALRSLDKDNFTFTGLVFAIRLNPGMLNRLLKSLTSDGLVEKSYYGYAITPTGSRVLALAELIIGTE